MVFACIVVLCYITVAAIRKTPIRNEWLPLISGGLGTLLALAAFYVFPEYVQVPNVGISLLYGLLSGLAATGSNQVYKQAIKYIVDKSGINIVIPADNTDDKE